MRLLAQIRLKQQALQATPAKKPASAIGYARTATRRAGSSGSGGEVSLRRSSAHLPLDDAEDGSDAA